MERERITAWVTKYALTDGIEIVSAEHCSDINDGMISYGNGYSAQTAHGKDWHITREAAIARAEEMRKAKIASLKRSICKLESMTFIAPTAE